MNTLSRVEVVGKNYGHFGRAVTPPSERRMKLEAINQIVIFFSCSWRLM